MKYYHGIMLFILCLFTLLFMNNTGETKEFHYDVEQLVQAFKSTGIEVETWNVYAREEKAQINNYEDFKREVERLDNKLEGFTWSIEKTEHVWKAVAEKNYPDLHITEQVLLAAYPTKKNHQTYLIYDVEGVKWEQRQWSRFSEHLAENTSKIFHKYPQFYSCISGQAGDMMIGVLQSFSEQLLAELNAQPVNIIKEKGFIAISGYSNLFTQEIALNKHEKMNVQVGLRQQGMGGITTVTIGTPVITLEY